MSRFGQGNSVFDREWAAKFCWYWGRGQSVFLRSNHAATVRRLEGKSRATEESSAEMFTAAEPWRQEIRRAVKDGISRSSLPWDPLITAAPTSAEIEIPAVVEADQRTKDWDIISDVSAGLRRLGIVCPEGPVVIELLFDDAAEDWTSMGLWHGPLYRLDNRAMRLMYKLRQAHNGRIQKQREKAERLAKASKRPFAWRKPELLTDLELMVADIAAAAQSGDLDRMRDEQAKKQHGSVGLDRLREYEAIEATARSLAVRVAGVWDALHRSAA